MLLHGSVLTYRPWRDGKLIWPSWDGLPIELLSARDWAQVKKRMPARNQHPNHQAMPPTFKKTKTYMRHANLRTQ